MSGSRFYQRASLAGLINAVSGKGLALVNLWLWNRLLLHHEFGEFIFAVTIIEILALTATAGLDQGVIFRISRDSELPGARRFAGASLGVAIGIGLVIALGISALAGFGNSWISMLSIAIPVKAAAYVLGGWRRGRSQVASAIFLEQSFPTAIKTALLAVAVIFSFGTRAVIVAEIVAPLLALLPFWFQDRLNPFEALGRGLRELDLRYSLHLLGTRLLQRALDRSDIVMLGILATTSIVADYAVAARLAALVLLAHEMLNAAFTVRAGKWLGEGKKAEAHLEYRRVQIASTAGALGVATVLGGFGGMLMSWLGEFRNAYPILLILILAHLAKVCFGPGGNYLKMAGRSGMSVLIATSVLGLNVVLNVFFIPIWGASGAAFATFFSMMISNMLATLLIWRVAKFNALPLSIALVLLAVGAITFASVLGGYSAMYISFAFLFLTLFFLSTALKSIQALFFHEAS